LALADAQRAGPPPMDGVDSTLAGIVVACLALEPENRPLHAGALAVALRGWIAGDPTAALAMAPTSTHRSVVDTGAVTKPIAVVPAPAVLGTSAVETQRGWVGARRALVLGVAALLAAAVMVMAISALTNPTAAEPTQSGVPTSVPTEAATPVPTQVALPPWAARLAEQYQEQCGTPLDPALIAGMNKKQAEDALEPLIDACEEAGD